MDRGAGSLQIVRTIMALARNLGMAVVAEGTETAGQVAQLQAMGCEFAQGYFFSRPVDLTGIVALLKRPSWPMEWNDHTEAILRRAQD
jgi:EAL domain-containing protein (putative c-di-GMP-specific phosphodiesterase class I)